MISFFKDANYSNVPFHNTKTKVKYMSMQKKPTLSVLRWIEGDLWGLDGGFSYFYPDHEILMSMGKILERVYTLDVDEFNTVFKDKNYTQKI